jgi:hypothetical protein
VGASSAEEGLTCIAELIFNQDAISLRMWSFYDLIITTIMTDRGILDEFLPQVSVPLINYISKNPDQFKSLSLSNT